MGDKNVAVFRRKNPYFSHDQREKKNRTKVYYLPCDLQICCAFS